ncbi:hypothetical protein L3V82_11595 [Thiotrichales bacterium 19S3-7]|nr:hypothetical protein [Thiotrichales bacterium 19S3-7]MCF6802857.1 hypothetical protein [Thiotrichales bacterium 19S3-11]
MPQVELRYSQELDLKVKDIFQKIEALINQIDSTAGVCKSRAYPTAEYLHPNCYFEIMVLRKAHRDKHFMDNLLAEIESVVKPLLPEDCYYSINLNFSSDYYFTSKT